MKTCDVTIVICCAGMGTRLGIGTTKALLKIDGESIIIKLLKLLDDYDDVRVVVGYQAQQVIDEIISYRKDIMFVFNHEYNSTGIGYSFFKAASWAREYIVEIDGDLLIEPTAFREFMKFDGECLAINKINSAIPIYVNIEEDKVTSFSREVGDYEWTGLFKIKANKVKKEREFIFEMIKPSLPIPYMFVESRDIDTQDDYDKALGWYRSIEKL